MGVAVLDVGLDPGHEDLNANVVSYNGPDVDHSHGTHVAGIACAQGNNGIGIAGVSWSCSLRLYEVTARLDAGVDAVTAASRMAQAVEDGAQVANMSLQWIDNLAGWGPDKDCSTPFDEASLLQKVSETNSIFSGAILMAILQGQDMLWVFAAGNECRDARFASPASLANSYPENAIAVGSFNRQRKRLGVLELRRRRQHRGPRRGGGKHRAQDVRRQRKL